MSIEAQRGTVVWVEPISGWSEPQPGQFTPGEDPVLTLQQSGWYTAFEIWWHTRKKPDFVFRRNGRVHLNRRAGTSVQSTTGSRVVHISGSNAGYNMFRGSVKSAGYPLHSPVSPSLPLPCVTVCHHISTAIYWGVGLDAFRKVRPHRD
jgi:hypothetical protein